MTLKVRIIPCLDVKDGRVVKGVNFVDLVDAGDPVEAAKAYDLPWSAPMGAHTSDNRSPVNEYEDRSGKKQQKWDHVMNKKNQNIEFK